MDKVIEVNNGRALQLSLTGDGLQVTRIDSNGNAEESYTIRESELVMLLNIYRSERGNQGECHIRIKTI